MKRKTRYRLNYFRFTKRMLSLACIIMFMRFIPAGYQEDKTAVISNRIVFEQYKAPKRVVTISGADIDDHAEALSLKKFLKSLEKEKVNDLEEPEQTPPLPSSKYTAEEIEILEKVTMAEAEGESYEGKVAVVNVILNRVASPWFPDTIKEVVFQPGQFTPIHDGRYEKAVPNEEVKAAVRDALNGKTVVDSDTLFFLNPKKAKDKTIMKKFTLSAIIGNHYFYK